jgi:hypothetical protein
MTWTQECIVPSTCLFRGLPCLVNSLSVSSSLLQNFSVRYRIPVVGRGLGIVSFVNYLFIAPRVVFILYATAGFCPGLNFITTRCSRTTFSAVDVYPCTMSNPPSVSSKTITRTHFVIVSSTLLHHNPNVEGL